MYCLNGMFRVMKILDNSYALLSLQQQFSIKFLPSTETLCVLVGVFSDNYIMANTKCKTNAFFIPKSEIKLVISYL
jgi:hypothetical protein